MVSIAVIISFSFFLIILGYVLIRMNVNNSKFIYGYNLLIAAGLLISLIMSNVDDILLIGILGVISMVGSTIIVMQAPLKHINMTGDNIKNEELDKN